MSLISKYSKYLPYLYFIAITIYWFTSVNKSQGLTAYPILLFAIPFLWQLIKPNKKLNFTLGITFVCLSSYMILAYISEMLNLISISSATKQLMLYGGVFFILNFFMALWIIKNSLNKRF
jgi:hypothetical protein